MLKAFSLPGYKQDVETCDEEEDDEDDMESAFEMMILLPIYFLLNIVAASPTLCSL